MLKHFIAVIFIVGMEPGSGYALEIYRIGGEEHPWEESWETSGETSLIDMTEGVIAPILVDPDRNLSLGLLDRGGLISPEGQAASMGFDDLTKMHALIDGDSTTVFLRYIDLEHVSRIWQDLIRIDLGGEDDFLGNTTNAFTQDEEGMFMDAYGRSLNILREIGRSLSRRRR